MTGCVACICVTCNKWQVVVSYCEGGLCKCCTHVNLSQVTTGRPHGMLGSLLCTSCPPSPSCWTSTSASSTRTHAWPSVYAHPHIQMCQHTHTHMKMCQHTHPHPHTPHEDVPTPTHEDMSTPPHLHEAVPTHPHTLMKMCQHTHTHTHTHTLFLSLSLSLFLSLSLSASLSLSLSQTYI